MFLFPFEMYTSISRFPDYLQKLQDIGATMETAYYNNPIWEGLHWEEMFQVQ